MEEMGIIDIDISKLINLEEHDKNSIIANISLDMCHLGTNEYEKIANIVIKELKKHNILKVVKI